MKVRREYKRLMAKAAPYIKALHEYLDKNPGNEAVASWALLKTCQMEEEAQAFLELTELVDANPWIMNDKRL